LTDIALFIGNDLVVGATGDLLTATGDAETQQRIVRRLLTVAGAYIQHLGYGAGLGQFVGQPTATARIAGVIKRQMKHEATVAQTPPATVTTTRDVTGNVTATIKYTDATTGQPSTLTFPVQ
jgi:hypothetical protein